MVALSLYRIVLRPSDPLLTIVDWGDMADIPAPPWTQQVQEDPLIGASWPYLRARGNVTRKWAITREIRYASAMALEAAVMSHDAALPIGQTTDLDVRILAQPDPGGTVAARTIARWTCARAVLESVVPTKNLPALRVAYVYTVKITNLTPAAP